MRLLGRLDRELGDGAGLMAILDYDGTLAPIASSPGAAVLAPSVRATLARLARSERARLAILSGRALADVRKRVGLDAVVYGGCHGLEIEGRGLRFRHPRVRPLRVAAVRRALVRGAEAIPGAHVEFKGLCVSLHYRNVAPRYRRDVLGLVARTAGGAPDIAVIDGTYELTGIKTPEGQDLPAVKGMYTNVGVKQNGQWLLHCSRPMLPMKAPGT